MSVPTIAYLSTGTRQGLGHPEEHTLCQYRKLRRAVGRVLTLSAKTARKVVRRATCIRYLSTGHRVARAQADSSIW
eukprot:1511841-Rhodomonas_salina.1